MNKEETNCQALKVLEERITRERELREAMDEKLEERDRRYEERFKGQETAVTFALSAQEKLTASAFASSEKAISKAEASQTNYNSTHNDLTRKMDGQYKEMLTRTEAETKLHALEEKIADLRESRSLIGGRDQNKAAVWVAIFSLFGAGVAIVLALIGRK